MNINETIDELAGLDEISVRFIRAVKVLKGNKEALQILEAIKSILGDEWAARVIFNQLSDNFSNIENFTIVGFDSSHGKKINAIKELRSISFIGLKEAKDAIEGAEQGKKFMVSIGSTLDAKQVDVSVRALRSFGARIVLG